MAGVQGVITLLLTVSMLWASLCVSVTYGQTTPCSVFLTCPGNYDPVCGSDFQTYGNDCELNRQQRCRNRSLYKLYDGGCALTTPCSIFIPHCSSLYSPVCGSDRKTYGSPCLLHYERRCRNPSLYVAYNGSCNPNCTMACPTYNSPVCGSNGVTYSNICFLNAAKCSTPSLYKVYEGTCICNTETPCTQETAVVCGSDGHSYLNLCFLNSGKCRNPGLYKVHDGQCDGCDKVCSRIYRPVCGSDGVTYGNTCQFEIAQCRNPNLKKLHDGECRGGSSITSNCDKPCPDHDQPVCGTNDMTYKSYCHFEIAQCNNENHSIPLDGEGDSAGKHSACPTLNSYMFHNSRIMNERQGL